MTGLAQIASATALAHGMLPRGAVVLALVSGGADSMALLRLLADGALGPPDGRLGVLHVNHMLRGEAADADEAFVREMCADLGVTCRAVRYDVAAYAQAEGLNLEDAGRRVRYAMAETELDALCDTHGADRALGRIAVAHTFDDRLETFLARLVSGAGPRGLGSIAHVRGRVVRPLLDARREDVVTYLAALGQDWREDATNADTTRERAWVRHELLPVVERRNPAFASVASRVMRLLADDDAALTAQAAAAAAEVVRSDRERVVFASDDARKLSPPVVRRVVRDALVGAFPGASRLEFEHVEAIVAGLGDPCFARDLPDGLRAETEYDTLRVSRRGETRPAVMPGLLEVPGMLDLGDAGTIVARAGRPGEVPGGPDTVAIDADAVAWPLVVDSPRDGDRMRPLGLGGTKKLSDVLIDAKVPKRLRRATPVVRDGVRIVWVAGVSLAEDARVTPETVRVAELTWRRPATGEAQPSS